MELTLVLSTGLLVRTRRRIKFTSRLSTWVVMSNRLASTLRVSTSRRMVKPTLLLVNRMMRTLLTPPIPSNPKHLNSRPPTNHPWITPLSLTLPLSWCWISTRHAHPFYPLYMYYSFTDIHPTQRRVAGSFLQRHIVDNSNKLF